MTTVAQAQKNYERRMQAKLARGLGLSNLQRRPDRGKVGTKLMRVGHRKHVRVGHMQGQV